MKRNNCRCCKSKDLYLYLDLGKQPLANSYHKGESLKRYPLEVNVCRECFHSQLSYVVNPDEMFKNYLYVSGTTDTFKNHCRKLALDALSRVDAVSPDVLDIACNDGTQLEYFRNFGANVVGVDPAVNLRTITKNKNIKVYVDYWTQKLAKSINKKFDLITGTNVFAHVDDLDEFLKASRIAMHESSLLILEFPYAENMITHTEFDTVYHEHLSYFLVNSFKVLIERNGLYIFDILRTQIHGGSIRFFLKKGHGKHSGKVSELIKLERKKGLNKIVTYKKFSSRVALNKNKMLELAENIRKKGHRIIGYAASAKGNTMLNYYGLTLDYIIDDNDLKWGYKTPGMDIPIVSIANLKNERGELYVVVLAWNFFNEIRRRLLNVKNKDLKIFFILYVPNIQKLSIKEDFDYNNSA